MFNKWWFSFCASFTPALTHQKNPGHLLESYNIYRENFLHCLGVELQDFLQLILRDQSYHLYHPDSIFRITLTHPWRSPCFYLGITLSLTPCCLVVTSWLHHASFQLLLHNCMVGSLSSAVKLAVFLGSNLIYWGTSHRLLAPSPVECRVLKTFFRRRHLFVL